jgi:thiamine biosynthesis lipoprotein
MTWKKFNALGSEVIITAGLSEEKSGLLEDAQQRVVDFERRFSRFIAGNELDRFNKNEKAGFKASPTMIDLLKACKSAYDLTGGIFDPTIIGSLEAIGYDRRFDDIDEISGGATDRVDPEKIRQDFLSRHRFRELEIDGDRVKKPRGMRLDFGGLGKGFIVDRLSDDLFSSVDDYWISAGGDLSVKGGDAAGAGWKIGVQDPNDPGKEIFWIRTHGQKCGIATSGVFKRKGNNGNFSWHHLIDPRSGLPVVNDILAVTAVSSSAGSADVFAKTVLILGEKEGLGFIEKQAESAVLIFFKDGRLSLSKRAMRLFRI